MRVRRKRRLYVVVDRRSGLPLYLPGVITVAARRGAVARSVARVEALDPREYRIVEYLLPPKAGGKRKRGRALRKAGRLLAHMRSASLN
jgi:hypothetical protein